MLLGTLKYRFPIGRHFVISLMSKHKKRKHCCGVKLYGHLPASGDLYYHKKDKPSYFFISCNV